MRIPRWLSLLSFAVLPPPATLQANAVAVSTVVFNGYARERQPAGGYRREYYVFGEGGSLSRPIGDPAMEQLTFVKIARVVAAPLAQQNYHPVPPAGDAGLLIIVFWGSTAGSRDNRNLSGALSQFASAASAYSAARAADPGANSLQPGPANPVTSAAQSAYDAALWQMQLDNDLRDRIDNENARILGFGDSLSRARFAPHMAFAQDTLAAISDNRYYVVLQAYDYKVAKQHKKMKPLWTSRISVSEQGDFAKALERMVWSGARFFGQETDGLKRQRDKTGSVELGPLEIIEVVPDAK